MRQRASGVCTRTFGSKHLSEIAVRCAALGLNGVELHGNLQRSAHEDAKLLQDHGLQVFSMTPGHGHSNFTSQFQALHDNGYQDPVIFELTTVGPDPFIPVKIGDYREALMQEELGKT